MSRASCICRPICANTSKRARWSSRAAMVVAYTSREYIESIAGLWCASLGFASERLAKVAYEQMRSLGYYHLYRHRSSACDCAGGGATQNRAGADGPRAISVFGLGGERHRY